MTSWSTVKAVLSAVSVCCLILAAACSRGSIRSAESYDEGRRLEKAEKYEDAIRAYREALRFRPDDPHAYYHLGNCYFHLRQFDAAVPVYRKAMSLAPDYAWPCIGLGRCYLDRDNEQAIALFKEAIRRAPDLAIAHYDLGEALSMQALLDWVQAGMGGRRDAESESPNMREAIAAYKEAIRLQPDLWFAYEDLAHCYRRLGREEDAAAADREAARLRPVKGGAKLGAGPP